MQTFAPVVTSAVRSCCVPLDVRVASAEDRRVVPVVTAQTPGSAAAVQRLAAPASAGRARGAAVSSRGGLSNPALVPEFTPNPAFEPTAASGVGSI